MFGKFLYRKLHWLGILILFAFAVPAGGQSVVSMVRVPNYPPRWDPSFGGVSSGIDGPVFAMTTAPKGSVFGEVLFAGGDFSAAGPVYSSNIAMWDGSAWSALDTGLAQAVKALVLFNGRLYAGSGQDVYEWDGVAWTSLGSPGGYVNALTGYNGMLHAGGDFSGQGKVKRWNGSSWSQVGGGFGKYPDYAEIFALEVFEGELYAGGSIIFSETSPPWPVKYGGLARLSGSSWVQVGNLWRSGGITFAYDPIVSAMTVVSEDVDLYLCIGGLFSGCHLARFDGMSIDYMGNGVDPCYVGPPGGVQALAAFDDGTGFVKHLYAGGSFNTVDAMALTVNHVVKWDWWNWEEMDGGVTNGYEMTCVDALCDYKGELHTGGDFQNAGSFAHSNIARWKPAWGLEFETPFQPGPPDPDKKAVIIVGLDETDPEKLFIPYDRAGKHVARALRSKKYHVDYFSWRQWNEFSPADGYDYRGPVTSANWNSFFSSFSLDHDDEVVFYFVSHGGIGSDYIFQGYGSFTLLGYQIKAALDGVLLPNDNKATIFVETCSSGWLVDPSNYTSRLDYTNAVTLTSSEDAWSSSFSWWWEWYAQGPTEPVFTWYFLSQIQRLKKVELAFGNLTSGNAQQKTCDEVQRLAALTGGTETQIPKILDNYSGDLKW